MYTCVYSTTMKHLQFVMATLGLASARAANARREDSTRRHQPRGPGPGTSPGWLKHVETYNLVGCYSGLMGFIGIHSGLMGFIGIHSGLMGFNGIYWDLLGFNGI